MSNQMPLISIIVPVYNTEKYLPKCIESLVCQTYTRIEIILVDDGSTDASGKICDDYAQKDSRIIVIHKENGGQACARNVGLNVANGEYIGFVDSDDYIAENMYQVLVEAALRYNAQVALCGRYNVNSITGKETPAFQLAQEECWTKQDAIKRFLKTDCLDASPCDKLFKLEVVRGIYFPDVCICEDIPFVYEILKKTNRVCHVGVPLYYYLQRMGSVSRPQNISSKTEGMVKYPEHIRKDIYLHIPHMKNEADAFYYVRVLWFCQKVESAGYKGCLLKNNKRILRENWLAIMVNPEICMYSKIQVLLTCTNTYLLARKIKNAITASRP